MKYILTKIAENDLLQIKYYSCNLWGNENTIKYLSSIHEKCIELCNFPVLGVERPEVNKAVRSILVGSHIIFYRIVKDKIQILRILHKNMDSISQF